MENSKYGVEVLSKASVIERDRGRIRQRTIVVFRLSEDAYVEWLNSRQPVPELYEDGEIEEFHRDQKEARERREKWRDMIADQIGVDNCYTTFSQSLGEYFTAIETMKK